MKCFIALVQDELDDLENDIGEASFANARREDRMSENLASRDHLFTRSWGEYKGDEAGERFLILDESPDGQEVNENFYSREFMTDNRSNRWNTDDASSVEKVQFYSIEEDENRDADLPSDEQESEKDL